MYHILVVDDEKILLEGMCRLLREELADCEIFGCLCASEALLLMEKERMDLAVLDIRMPGLTGLALQEKMGERQPGCRVIFLSGYDDFSYIQQAMRQNSRDYILKMEGDEVVVKAVKRCLKELQEEEEYRIRERNRAFELEKNRRIVRQEWLNRMIYGEEESIPGPAQAQSVHGEAEYSKLPDIFGMIVGMVTDEGKTPQSQIFAEEKDKAQAIFKEVMPKDFAAEGFLSRDGYLVWLFWPGERFKSEALSQRKLEQLKERLVPYLERVQDAAYRMLKRHILFAVSKEGIHKEEAGRVYRMARKLFKWQEWTESGGDVMFVERMPEERKGDFGPREEPAYVYRLLKHFVETQDKEGCQHYLDARLTEGNPVLTEQEFYQWAVLLHKLIEMYGKPGVEWRDFWEFKREGEMQMYFERLIDALFSLRHGESQESDPLILKIHRYIDKHLEEDVSMAAISREMHFNPSYLSRLYKSRTGSSITDYICRKRLELACAMLVGTDMKVRDIARKAGFSSPAYFTQSFTRSFHMSPLEYRNRKK